MYAYPSACVNGHCWLKQLSPREPDGHCGGGGAVRGHILNSWKTAMDCLNYCANVRNLELGMMSNIMQRRVLL